MRIIIAAPRKTGNSWLKCLLAAIYDLRWLSGSDTPASPELGLLREWLAGGGFPDDAIYHQHYDPSDEFISLAEAIPAHVATIVRDPYDMFVSLYFFVQTQAENPNRIAKGRTRDADVMAGRPIDHPDVLAFLADGFDRDLGKGIAWIEGGRSVVVRYEDLHDDPQRALEAATAAISPVGGARIAAAIGQCQAEQLLRSRKGLQRRIRSATVGDWRNHLTEQHLAIFRDRHADSVRRLGYGVR